jgi:hypothetical protein
MARSRRDSMECPMLLYFTLRHRAQPSAPVLDEPAA